MNEKTYELRRLCADDIFPMFQILSKVGIKEFKSCFESPEVKDLVARAAKGEKGYDSSAVGLTLIMEIAGVLLANLPKAKKDIYLLLSQVSGWTEADIAAMPMADFMQMVIDLVKKEEFKDFFGVAAKLFK